MFVIQFLPLPVVFEAAFTPVSCVVPPAPLLVSRLVKVLLEDPQLVSYHLLL